MQRPNITEERFDEICSISARIDAVINLMSEDFDDNEKYMIITLLFVKRTNDQLISDDMQAEGLGAAECQKNLLYVRDLLMKKVASLEANKKKDG